jgi:hypothetical protein
MIDQCRRRNGFHTFGRAMREDKFRHLPQVVERWLVALAGKAAALR